MKTNLISSIESSSSGGPEAWISNSDRIDDDQRLEKSELSYNGNDNGGQIASSSDYK